MINASQDLKPLGPLPPEIWDAILSYSSHTELLVLSVLSKTLKDRVDSFINRECLKHLERGRFLNARALIKIGAIPNLDKTKELLSDSTVIAEMVKKWRPKRP